MGFFKHLKKHSIKKTAPPPPALVQREAVAKHLAKSWVENLESGDVTDQRMKAAGYVPMGYNGKKFNGELQVNPFFTRGK